MQVRIEQVNIQRKDTLARLIHSNKKYTHLYMYRGRNCVAFQCRLICWEQKKREEGMQSSHR